MDVQPDSTESAQNDVSFHEDFKGQPSINMIMKQNAVESDKDRTGNVTDGPKLSGELLKGGEHDHTICGRDVGVNINVPPSSSSPPSSSLGSSWCSSSPSITTALITNTSSQGYSESDTLFSCLQSNKPADLKESLSENVAFLRSVRNVLRSWCTPMTLEYLGLSHTMRSKGCDGESDQEGEIAAGFSNNTAFLLPSDTLIKLFCCSIATFLHPRRLPLPCILLVTCICVWLTQISHAFLSSDLKTVDFSYDD